MFHLSFSVKIISVGYGYLYYVNGGSLILFSTLPKKNCEKYLKLNMQSLIFTDEIIIIEISHPETLVIKDGIDDNLEVSQK